MRPSLRVVIAIILFAGAALAALLFSPDPGWHWRGSAAALVIALGWKPVTTIVFGLGAGTVRRIEWRPDGAWHLYDRGGRSLPVELSSASVTLGPWLLLIWTHPKQGRRFHALIDASRADTGSFRALKGRLNC